MLERAGKAGAGEMWDKRILGGCFALSLVTFVIAGIDSGRFGCGGVRALCREDAMEARSRCFLNQPSDDFQLLIEALRGDRRRRAEFLREQRDFELFNHPAERICLALRFGRAQWLGANLFKAS